MQKYYGRDLKEYRNMRMLTLREVADALKGREKTLTNQFISQVENEQKPLNEENYRTIIDGINLAFAKKCREKNESKEVKDEKDKEQGNNIKQTK